MGNVSMLPCELLRAYSIKGDYWLHIRMSWRSFVVRFKRLLAWDLMLGTLTEQT
jgi:hypothetical protein